MLKIRPIVLLGIVALLLALAVTACAGSKPTPTHTPSPTATATPTPVPTATSTPLPTPTPTATPVPLNVTAEDARYLAILNTVALYPGIMEAEWAENVISLPTVGTAEVDYTYGEWVITVKYPVVAEPEYEVTLVHQGLGIQWTGTVKQDGMVEGPEITNFFGLAPIMIVTMTPSAMDGKIVTLVGEYRGWRPEDGLPPPETKSDWVLNDNTGEMYVTGASPADFDPVEDIGKMVTATGIIKVVDGIAYLKAVEVQEGMYEGPLSQ